MINARINIEGEINPRLNIEGTVNASTVKVYPNLENIEITPSKEEQTFKSENYYGFDEVKVNKVTNEVDKNIKPENIKKGVEILGVTGKIEELKATELTIVPNAEEQVIEPVKPNNSFSKVTVNKVTSNIDKNIKAENIKKDIDILGVMGSFDGIIPTGTIDITSNGEYDVKNYANANVTVGGTSVGLITGDYDDKGYPRSASIVGLTELPNRYLYQMFGSDAFLFKTGLNFTLSNDLEKIGTYCFYGGTYLEMNELPSSLTSIGSNAFYNCGRFAIKSLPSGITKIESQTFRYSGLTEMTCYGDITRIGSSAFSGVSTLKKIIFPNNTTVPTLDGSVFSSTQISNGTGYIYFPDTLVETAKSSTNWSVYANQIKGVSEL